MNTNQESIGHLFFHGDYEYFEKDTKIYKSAIRHPIGLDGYRQAKKIVEFPSEEFNYLIQAYSHHPCFTTWSRLLSR